MLKEHRTTELIFFFNGVESLLGWNAVITAFDFFGNSFTEYNVYSLLPVPVVAAELLISLCFHKTSNRFKYITHIICGNIIINICLVLLLLVSLLLKQTLIGFVLLLLISFFIGIGTNLTQLTFFAMINYLSQDVVSKFNIGVASSGLFIVIVRAIVTAIFGSDNVSSTPTFIYFSISIVFITLNLFSNVYFCNSEVYKHKIDYFLLHSDVKKYANQTNQRLQKNEQRQEAGALIKNEDQFKDPLLSKQYIDLQERIQKQSYFKTLFQTSKNITPYLFFIMFNFIITFTMFPGPSFSKKVNGIDATWCVIIYNTAYNLGDTVGRYLSGLNNFFNHKSLIYTLIVRLFFFFPVTIMATGADLNDDLIDNYVFPFANLFLFAVTNGMVTNGSFIMSFKICLLAYKKYAGVLCGLLLQIGILLGTVMEIPYSTILDIN